MVHTMVHTRVHTWVHTWVQLDEMFYKIEPRVNPCSDVLAESTTPDLKVGPTGISVGPTAISSFVLLAPRVSSANHP